MKTNSPTTRVQSSPAMKVIRIVALICLVPTGYAVLHLARDLKTEVDTARDKLVAPLENQRLDTAVRTTKLMNKSFVFQGLNAQVIQSAGDDLVLSLENKDGGFKLITLKLDTVEDIYAQSQLPASAK